MDPITISGKEKRSCSLYFKTMACRPEWRM